MRRYDITVGDCEGRVDTGAELASLREQVKVLREALGGFLFAFGLYDSDDERLDEFRRLRRAARANFSTDLTVIKEDPEKLAKLIAARVNGFGLLSARKLVSGLGTLDSIINAEPADLDAIFGKGSIKSIHLRKYLDDPAAVERLRERLQTKPKDGE